MYDDNEYVIGMAYKSNANVLYSMAFAEKGRETEINEPHLKQNNKKLTNKFRPH